MKKLLFIYNPQAGKGQVRPQLAAILDAFSKAGYLTSAWPTQGPGDATRVAAAIGRRYDRVVCCGGDGTLNEVVTGLMGLEAPPLVGYIPAGTTNDFSRNLDLPKGMDKAAEAAVAGVARPCDIGVFNDRFFVYVAAFGAFTKVAYDTPQDLKNTFGHLAYIFEGIASLPTITPYHLRVDYDGQVIEDNFYFGMVTNAMSVSGIKMPQSEQVVLDDGLFEVVLVKKPLSLGDLANALQALINLTPTEDSGSLVRFQASRLTFTCGQPISWTVDGEFGGCQPVSQVVNRQRALQIIQGT